MNITDYHFYFCTDFVQYYALQSDSPSSASLHCGSTSRPFPSDASRVYWYKEETDTAARILYYSLSDSSSRYYNGYSSPKYSCNSDRMLIITDVQIGDYGKYICKAFGSTVDFNFRVSLGISGKFFHLTFVTIFLFRTSELLSSMLVIFKLMSEYEMAVIYNLHNHTHLHLLKWDEH